MTASKELADVGVGHLGGAALAASDDSPPGTQDSLAERAKSPGLRAGAGAGTAYEIKFLLTTDDLPRMNAWAQRHLQPDPHGDEGSYRVTSVYCDTPNFDVFHRSPGYRASKLRMRRYGSADFVFLERKIKRGDRVRKRRVEVAPGDLPTLAGYMAGGTPPQDWAASWFLGQALKKRVAPTCRVGYRRTAYFGMVDGQSVRVTIDQDLIGVPTRGWEAQPLLEGLDLLPGGALLELKFHDTMPSLFRALLPELPVQNTRVSKYRRCVRLCGLAQERTAPAAGMEPQGR